MGSNEEKWEEMMSRDAERQRKCVRAEKLETANNIFSGVTFIIMIVGIIVLAVIAAVVFGIDIFG